MKSDARRHAREQLDERLSVLKPENRFHMPPKGWIRAIRDAIGMSGVQFASRLGVRPQTVQMIERSEAAGSIQIGTLRRAAEALDCTLVYALVPRRSLENTVRQRARTIAIRDLQRIAHSMNLEAQGTGEAMFEDRIERYIRDEIKDRDLWNET